jgi:hypothetical protein
VVPGTSYKASFTLLRRAVSRVFLAELAASSYAGLTAADIASKVAVLVYEADFENLDDKFISFKNSDEGKAFEEIVGAGSSDLILQFLADAERKLWEKGYDAILSELLAGGSVGTLTAQVRDELILENPATYGTLNINLNQKTGIDLEGLFTIKDHINNKLVFKKVITAEELTTLRNAFLDAAFEAGAPKPSVQPKPHEIVLPEAAADVVREKNPNTDKFEIITKVSKEKVNDIVSLITAEKNTIPLKLKTPPEGERVKASVPASLFTEASEKNPHAVVDVQTEEASYKLPVKK